MNMIFWGRLLDWFGGRLNKARAIAARPHLVDYFRCKYPQNYVDLRRILLEFSEPRLGGCVPQGDDIAPELNFIL